MSVPADLLTDLDVLALDNRATSDYGIANATLSEKRRVAVTDWLRPRIEQVGYRAHRHLARRAPDAGWQLTGGVYTDRIGEFGDDTTNDVDLHDVFVTPGTDALYIGSREPFRGVYVAMIDSLNTAASVASLTYWNGAWTAPSSVVDGTIQASGKSFSGSGRITWSLPDDWHTRQINNSPAYWVRLTVSARPTDETRVGQVLPLSRSRLTYPAALYALGLLYQEGIGNQRGDYAAKADRFFAEAERALAIALPLISDEFDVDASGALERLEVNSIARSTQNLFTWERG